MDSKLILCQGVHLDKSYTNVLSYNLTNRLSLVESKAQHVQANYNFIDYTKNEIMANVDYSIAIDCNYMAFQNPQHGNKWYFAFIDDVKYKAPNQSLVKFTIDVWSTFFDDWDVKPCFVVREHVNDDTAGLHTVPEEVTTGDYVAVFEGGVQELLLNPKIIVSSTVDEGGTAISGNIYDGIPTAYNYYRYGIGDMADVQSHINAATAAGGDINQLFIAPAFIVGGTIGAHLIEPRTAPKIDYIPIPDVTALGAKTNGYVPKNKKLLTYPFVYHKITNMQGQEAILHQELWQESTKTGNVPSATQQTGKLLEISACLTAGCSVKASPINYANITLAPDYGITGAKYPQLNWKTDSYINWLTQQGVNSLTQSVEDVLTGSSGISSIGNLLWSNYKAYKTPPQVHGNTNAGDVMFARGTTTLYVLSFSIRREYAEQIDDYFSRYGYKINDIKVPNLSGRQNFNFVEIGKDECIGYGKVPSKYMDEINNICRQGVTIWHNHDNLGNYNVSNNIV